LRGRADADAGAAASARAMDGYRGAVKAVIDRYWLWAEAVAVQPASIC